MYLFTWAFVKRYCAHSQKGIFKATKNLDGDELRECFDAVMNYGLYEKQSKLSDKLQSLFELIKPQIDANIKRRINSKKGGRKPSKE